MVFPGHGSKGLAQLTVEQDTVADWAQRQGLSFTTYRDLSEKPEVIALVQGIVTAANAHLATAAQIKRFRLLPKLLDENDGELTATQKVKRSAIGARFEDLVTGMYGGAA